MSSSGKTQHFDCCIRRFESCHPSQKQQTQFCVCCFLFSFSAGFEPIVHLLRSKRDIKLLQATRLALSDPATPARKKHLLLQVLFSVLFALWRVLLLRSDIRLSAECYSLCECWWRIEYHCDEVAISLLPKVKISRRTK